MHVDNAKKIHVTKNQPEFSKRNRFTSNTSDSFENTVRLALFYANRPFAR